MPVLKIFDGNKWHQIWGAPSSGQADWNETNPSSVSFIRNKPNIITDEDVPKVNINTKYNKAQLRNIIYSTSEPAETDGNDGDLWIIYEE